jgi:putative Mg2+ transporter-C (MgtC) family protein
MTLQQEFEATLLLALAGLLSAIVGIDRENHAPAGLRTHMLVGMGACLFTLLSIHAFPGGDPARIAAQIVTGIGFLGAGTIMQRKGDVHFLTTAASIWVTAAVGMAVGAGEWFLGTTSTLLIWVVLKVIRRFQSDKTNEEENPN